MSELIQYEQALRKLQLDTKSPINSDVCSKVNNYTLDLDWVRGKAFSTLFLPFVKIKIDSREQDDWVQRICEYFGISYEVAVKNKKNKTENLKEGDITFSVHFGNKVYDYTNIVAYERKGSASEFCNNIMGDRKRIEREFERQLAKGYKKFVLLLEFGNKIDDLIDYEFFYYNHNGKLERKSCGMTVYATVCSWIQPNKYAFDVIQYDTQNKSKREQSKARARLFCLMLYDMYYFFRQEIRLEAQALVDANKEDNNIKEKKVNGRKVCETTNRQSA